MSSRGGYHPDARMARLLDEIRVTVVVGRAEQNPQQRDRAFDEVLKLVDQARELVSRSASDEPVAAVPTDEVQAMLERPNAPDEPPVRVMLQIARLVEDTVADAIRAHEQRYHAPEHLDTED